MTDNGLLLQKINEKYGTFFTTIRVADTTLKFLQVKEETKHLEDVIDKWQRGQTIFPFWTRIWEANLILARFMSMIPTDPAKPVLELGAGMGVTGLFASAFGHEVILTDLEDEALDFARINIAENKLTNVTVRRLDWMEPDMDRKFDLIIGSEILYEKSVFPPLVALIDRLLTDDGVIYLAQGMDRPCAGFFKLLGKRFKVASLPNRLKSGSDEYKVHVFAIKRA
ncbi:MAG: methyltransferase domain-containing protein [Deltaproteobacteria bacterium]|nr:methyltransferase domain-containing protein [Deltaproteobacteria bacterium]